jgi:hypothetical protein
MEFTGENKASEDTALLWPENAGLSESDLEEETPQGLSWEQACRRACRLIMDTIGSSYT